MTKTILPAAGKDPKAAAPAEPERAYPPIRWANEAAALELYELCLREAEAEIAAEAAAAARSAGGATTQGADRSAA